MISDTTFVDSFIKTNQNNLAEAYQQVTTCLNECGIPFIGGQAGFFIILDLRKYLPNAKDWDSEMKLWTFLVDECKVV